MPQRDKKNLIKLPVLKPTTGTALSWILFVVFGLTIGLLFAKGTPDFLRWISNRTSGPSDELKGIEMAQAASFLLGFLLGAGLANLVMGVFYRIGDRWDHMDSGDKVTLFLGVLVGLVGSVPFLFFLNSLSNLQYAPLAMLVLTVAFTSLSVYVLNSMAEIFPWSKGRGRGRRRGVKVLDTNVIIDGRIYDVARTGFLEGQLYVPGFVLEELQYIADSHDPLRRQRGRRGLDVLRLMQADFQLEVKVHDRLAPEIGDEVDARLVRLAVALGADLVTNDHNLNRVAALQHIRVLNINDLALGLRPNVLPQESLNISIIREGNQPGQGVGYLDDGTMVVVESGKQHLGETHDVIVTQVIQTERGKMIFAEMQPDDHYDSNGHGHHPQSHDLGSGKKKINPRKGSY